MPLDGVGDRVKILNGEAQVRQAERVHCPTLATALVSRACVVQELDTPAVALQVDQLELGVFDFQDPGGCRVPDVESTDLAKAESIPVECD